MKLRSSRFSALVTVAVCVLSGCASVPQSGVEGGATEVKVYGSGKLAASQYEVVRRLWVDSWRAAFWLPTYPSEAEGIASLQTEAGRLGADGLIIEVHPRPSCATVRRSACGGTKNNHCHRVTVTRARRAARMALPTRQINA